MCESIRNLLLINAKGITIWLIQHLLSRNCKINFSYLHSLSQICSLGKLVKIAKKFSKLQLISITVCLRKLSKVQNILHSPNSITIVISPSSNFCRWTSVFATVLPKNDPFLDVTEAMQSTVQKKFPLNRCEFISQTNCNKYLASSFMGEIYVIVR